MPETEEVTWNYVSSSNIAAWRYFEDTQVLEIQFLKSEGVYSYDDVPPEVADGFKSAISPGQYFRSNILNRYRYYRG